MTYNNKIDEKLWSAACSNNIKPLMDAYNLGINLSEVRVYFADKEFSLMCGAFNSQSWKAVDYLLSIGAAPTESEIKSMIDEVIRIDYMRKIIQQVTAPEQKQERQFTYDEGFEDGIQAGKDECLDIFTQMLNSCKYDSNTIQAAIEAIENN